ncbi:MAG: protein translocase subunit SecF, partial [archaeon]|nr:protein translocase subunit SecF [archaeon]
LLLIALSLLGIVVYITFAFRRIAGPVKFWHWSAAALVALVHDLLIPLGVFAVLGAYRDIQVTIPIVVALLTVVGYSINDTVVVFDRVRENIGRKIGNTLEETVQYSIKQALSRSLATSLTTLIVLVAIFFFGGETLKYFALALIIGVVAGTYSSLFVAPAILVQWFGRKNS